MQTREKIETSGRESRWEFSKTALFERTSHMAQMCSSLLSMLETIYTLNGFLGPQLEAVTGNAHVYISYRITPAPQILVVCCCQC